MIRILELFGGIGSPRIALRNLGVPVVIEAYQTDKEMNIETLEGTMHASVGDCK